MRNVFIGTAVIAVLSLLGAAAFNPDSGFLFRSEETWRIFGLVAYVSWYLLPLIGLVAAIRLVVGWSAGLCRHSRDA
jgi:hypothetical protein